MRIDLPGDLHAPAAARRFVLATIAASGPRAGHVPTDDVVLAVSELVTNSVRAQAREIGVEVVVDDDCVELRVTDDASGWPTVHQPDWEETAGRGLAIVEEIADAWYATDLARGKRVTARWSGRGVGV